MADKLINAENAGAFLREPGVAASWETVSALKAEVDRLIGTDLNAAERLSERVEQVASALGDATSRAFAEASRARVLHHIGRYAEADALYQYERAREILASASDDTLSAVVDTNLSHALMEMDRHGDAA